MSYDATDDGNGPRIDLIESEDSLDAFTAPKVRDKLVWPATENALSVLQLTHVDRAFDIAEDIDTTLAGSGAAG